MWHLLWCTLKNTFSGLTFWQCMHVSVSMNACMYVSNACMYPCLTTLESVRYFTSDIPYILPGNPKKIVNFRKPGYSQEIHWKSENLQEIRRTLKSGKRSIRSNLLQNLEILPKMSYEIGDTVSHLNAL